MSGQLDFTHEHYRKILRAGLDSGYRFAFFDDLSAISAAGQRACFLRHDCDNDLVAAARLAAIETEMGVASTWFVMPRSAMYNLLAPTNRHLVARILTGGHRLGLHFDASLWTDAPDDAMRAEVRRECGLLQDEFGQPITVISFHQPDQRILSGAFDPEILHTYDKRRLDGVFYYSDSNLKFREGCPSEVFVRQQHRRIQLLVHPEWWTEEKLDLRQKWARMLANNVELAQSSLLERERTYTSAHRIKFDE